MYIQIIFQVAFQSTSQVLVTGLIIAITQSVQAKTGHCYNYRVYTVIRLRGRTPDAGSNPPFAPPCKRNTPAPIAGSDPGIEPISVMNIHTCAQWRTKEAGGGGSWARAPPPPRPQNGHQHLFALVTFSPPPPQCTVAYWRGWGWGGTVHSGVLRRGWGWGVEVSWARAPPPPNKKATSLYLCLPYRGFLGIHVCRCVCIKPSSYTRL